MDASTPAGAADSEELPLGVLLFIPYRALEVATMDGLARAGYTDMTVAQARIAARIDPGGSRVTHLAAAAQVTKQTAGFLVEQLERAGYVERVPDPTDGRARLVRIAARGSAAREKALPALAEVEAQWLAHVGPERMAQLRETLTMLREIADPFAKNRTS
ncbi:MAG: Transcriptional regulator, MarR family [uncultured Friedmanniella sp.]|uniref:Transcriptional regulator, MarR family n=1 Tax=uncultured Friedmanniella sp. TaxID=335381 RepID=A0A6J4JRK7_9ACTN|nr:MAG: Transcriptional regulator, MarR family [uncultured Friedmanniella sp.]